MKKEFISENQSLISLLKITWFNLCKKRRIQIKFLFVIVFFNSFAEVISITSLVPYLAVVINPENILENDKVRFFISLIGIKESSDLILPFTLIFLSTTVIAGCVRFVFNYFTLRIASNIGSDLSIKAYKCTINRSYPSHLSNNSNILLTTISKDIGEITYYIFNPIFHLFSAIFISISILITLLIINFYIALSSFIIISLIYLGFIKLTAKSIKNISTGNLFRSQKLTKLVQETMGSIKDIILSKNQTFYTNTFEINDRIYRKEEAKGNFLNLAPRLIIEPLGIIIVASFGYYLVSFGKIQSAIPIMGALSFSAVRLLPFAQRIYEGITLPRIAKSRLVNLLKILANPPKLRTKKNLKNAEIIIKDKIELLNISFRHNSNSYEVLKDLNLSINSGDKIGLIGRTGSGKSTLVDIIMGLLKPSKGKIYIDDIDLFNKGRAGFLDYWQRSLMHVPQNIFLADSSIAENIALGVDKKNINYEEVYKAAQKSQLMDFIETTKYGFDTHVGERGVRLSGGQRQRIGIARAFYKGSKFILLDEATSALDNKTEKLVMDSFNDLASDVTIIIIAHRLNSLRFCNKVFELNKGKLEERNIFNSK